MREKGVSEQVFPKTGTVKGSIPCRTPAICSYGDVCQALLLSLPPCCPQCWSDCGWPNDRSVK